MKLLNLRISVSILLVILLNSATLAFSTSLTSINNNKGSFYSVSAELAKNHTVIVGNNFFSPKEVQINIGDRLFFEWNEDALGHNIAQVESSSKTSYKSGFRSGDPVNGPLIWELPDEFTQTNVTLFYICEPHVIAGMRGKVIVGEGSPEPRKSGGFTVFELFMGLFISYSVIHIIKIKKKKK